MGLREVRRLGRLALAGLVAAACGTRPDATGAADLEAMRAAEAGLDAALAPLEDRTRTPRPDEARRAIAVARAARNALEAMRVGPETEAAWREELVFLNHVLPALERYGENSGDAAALEQLRSLLARGRAHQRRGRKDLSPR